MSKKKLVSILLSAVLCFGMLGSTFSASAAHVTVHLTKTQAVNSSSNVHGSFKYYWGKNSKSSKYSVYYIARYKHNGVWHTGGSDLLAAGEERSEKDPFVTKKLDYKTDWFLKLNPEGKNTKGCDAWGYMKNA
jgi:hypothetical protein